jgi:hypothetical protein
MVILRSCAFGAALLVGSACADDDQSPTEKAELTTSSTTTTSTTIESPPTTEATSTTTSVDLDPDTRAAIDFIDAWAQGDDERMRQLAPADQMDIAMGLGTAEGESDCSTQTSGQYQCVVDVSSGTRAYLLIGEPGDRAGRVWWIAEYVPGT